MIKYSYLCTNTVQTTDVLVCLNVQYLNEIDNILLLTDCHRNLYAILADTTGSREKLC